ncbi:hypothetical protein BLNAU_23925 [Blattamonas nauphoetae]|uniref:Uncharacterized protein n=1 Tax=Blattamonas nauphoetae TaxID=2049346 RepID=A0ABQ9WNV1_9EUKA|nr:hypothetical protein BLNAU_23925 [Blattamonas nauphoetae]
MATVRTHLSPNSRKRCDGYISELLEDDWVGPCDLRGDCIFVRGTGTAIEATRKVIDCLQTLFSRVHENNRKDMMRCVYVLADLPPEHQLVLVESELLWLAWNHRFVLKSDAAKYLVHSFKQLLSQNDTPSPAVATVLLRQIQNRSFASDLDRMCNHQLPDIRECYERLRTFLGTIPTQGLIAVPSLPVNRSST